MEGRVHEFSLSGQLFMPISQLFRRRDGWKSFRLLGPKLKNPPSSLEESSLAVSQQFI
jgi:hypothetical protein